STGGAGSRRAVPLVPQPAGGPRTLTHDTHLGSGVHVSVDLMSPDRWHAVTVPGATAAESPLVEALVGEGATSGAAPWLRIAVVGALDRWLQAPLEQSLVDAERGVSRGCAARTLPPGQARALLVGDALRLARRASHGFAAFLRGLARRSDPVPNAVVSACG